MKSATPFLAMIATGLVTLTMVVCCLGMGANASPEQIRALKRWMLLFTGLGLSGILGGVVLLRQGQSDLAAGVSIAPAVILAIIGLVALLK